MRKIILNALKLLGVAILCGFIWFVAGVLWPMNVPKPNIRHERLLITNTHIVDVESGGVIRDQNILVANGMITAVDQNITDATAKIIDAGGRYAMPGMFDMHAHSIKMAPVLTHPLFIASGVTAVRDMNGCLGGDDAWAACVDEKRAWDDAVDTAEIVGPRYDQITSLAVNGGSEVPDGFDRALGGETAEGAKARVQYDKARGIDFMKPYNRLPRESYFALAEAAKEHDMYLAGHLPFSVTGLEAIAAGQRSIEHAVLFIWECYPGMDDLRGEENFFKVYTNALRLKMINEHDSATCENLMKAMAEAGTAFVPTHTTRKLDAFALNPEYRSDPRLAYVAAPLRMLWRSDADSMARRAGAGGQESYQAIYDFGLQLTGQAQRAGVVVLAGTDAPDSFAFPGLGMADELGHFIDAGLTPLEAVQSATIKPAMFLGLEDQAGIIKPGARADIVLLDHNPLQSIDAIKSVNTVVLAGTVYDRSDLDQLMAGVKHAADAWYIWPKFIWQGLSSPIMRKQFAD